MPTERRTCPECGKDVARTYLSVHRREVHGLEPGPRGRPPKVADEEPGQEWSTDQPPREQPAAKKAAKKAAAPKRKATPSSIPPLATQLAFPYMLIGDLTARRLPITGQVIQQQAPACGAAWDQFLYRFPSLRAKIEEGAIATDILALIMAHLPIIQCAREEIAAQQAQAQGYDGGIGNQAEQPAAAA